jgi:uncharacterized membrane protein
MIVSISSDAEADLAEGYWFHERQSPSINTFSEAAVVSEGSKVKAEVRNRSSGTGLSVGAAVGVALGAAFGHLALGLALGAAIGAVVDVVMHVNRKIMK